MKKAIVLSVCALAFAARAYAGVCIPPVVVDGNLDATYGPSVSTQTTQTQFGDNGLGQQDYANGSELDGAYGVVYCSTLYLFIAGNLESNFNKLEIFFDTQAGGQNQLRGDNANVDFNGLNRMGADPTGPGLKFDPGFEADYYLTCGGGGGPYNLYCNYATLPTGGAGSGNYLGAASAGNGTLSGGTNPDGIQMTIINSNTGGVSGGCSASSGAGVLNGIEVAIPLSALGNPTGCFTVCAFVNGGGHDYVSNQVLGPLVPGTCNLGEPRVVDFGQQPGNQYFSICPQTTPAKAATWGTLRRSYR